MQDGVRIAALKAMTAGTRALAFRSLAKAVLTSEGDSTMAYRIEGLAPEAFESLFGMMRRASSRRAARGG